MFKVQIILYIIALVIGAVNDYKKYEVSDKLILFIALISILNFNVTNLYGILIGVLILLLEIIFNLGIGGGDIKFLMATGLVFGYQNTIVMTLFGMGTMIIFWLIIKGKKEVFKLPFLPFYFLGNIGFLVYNLFI